MTETAGDSGNGSKREPKEIKHDVDILLLLERGRRLSIINGESRWDAIYWGSMEDGRELLVWRSQDHWDFVPLDLHPLADKLETGALVSRAEIRAIEGDLVAQGKVLPNGAMVRPVEVKQPSRK